MTLALRKGDVALVVDREEGSFPRCLIDRKAGSFVARAVTVTSVAADTFRGRIRTGGARVVERADVIAVRSSIDDARTLFERLSSIGEAARDEIRLLAEHGQPGRMVIHAALLTVRVEWSEQYHGLESSMHAWRCNLLQPPFGRFSTGLASPYAAAKGKTDSNAVVLVEQILCLLERDFGSLRTLSGDRHFQVQKFNHSSASSILIPSIRKPSFSGLVPIVARGDA
ncbi:hypothetical protein NKI96_11125 [Mesorhizobium sp. M0292]|uniref:hypothetical protein n=1 Tax=Mesorhizobium sp. M0292 TaxID=2956929 RepID=UPI003334D37E